MDNCIKIPFTVRSGVTFWTCVTDVLLGRDGVLVVVDGGDTAGRAEVVGGDLERALAPLAVVDCPHASVAVKSFHASVTFGTESVVLAFLLFKEIHFNAF